MKSKLFYCLFFVFSLQLSAQNDTIVVDTYNYTIQDSSRKAKALYSKDNPDRVLNGQYKVMKTNSWHEDMFLKNNLLHGKNYIYYINHLTEERNYYQGQLDGKQYIYHTNYKDGAKRKGSIYQEKNYNKGLQIDTSFMYYEDGGIQALGFYNEKGRAHGRHSMFYPNIKLKQVGKYNDGKAVGTWSFYYPNGRLSKVQKYDKDGSLSFEQTYYSNGKKNIEKHLNKKVYIGKYERFEEDGKRIFLYNYKNGYERGKQLRPARYDNSNAYSINGKGQMHGDFEQRHTKTNTLQIKGKFNNGLRHSKWFYYMANGKMFREEYYKNGRRVSTSNKPQVYDDGEGNRIKYDENFKYTIPEENPIPEEKQMVEEAPFFLFGE